MNWDDKVWLVTGGTKGIGLELVKFLMKSKAKVATCSREDKPIGDFYRVLDVADSDGVQRFVDDVVARYAKIDVLVNNAGFYKRSTIEETEIEDWDTTINTNLNGTFYFCKYVLPYMKKENFGRIVNVSSYVASYTPPERAAYSCSKLAVLGLTETLAKEVKDYDITVNAFSPWKTATRMDVDGTAKSHPKDVAKHIYNLCRSDSDGKFFIEGEEVDWRLP